MYDLYAAQQLYRTCSLPGPGTPVLPGPISGRLLTWFFAVREPARASYTYSLPMRNKPDGCGGDTPLCFPTNNAVWTSTLPRARLPCQQLEPLPADRIHVRNDDTLELFE